MRWAAGLDVPGVPANPNPARVLNLSLGGGGDVQQRRTATRWRAVNAAGAVVVAVGRQQHRACGRASRPIAPASSPSAALRHVGTKVGFSDLGPRSRSARRAATASTSMPGAPACIRSSRHQQRAHDADRRWRGRFDLHRQLQRVAGHELLGAAGCGHRRR